MGMDSQRGPTTSVGDTVDWVGAAEIGPFSVRRSGWNDEESDSEFGKSLSLSMNE